jgi:hypothetical protein
VSAAGLAMTFVTADDFRRGIARLCPPERLRTRTLPRKWADRLLVLKAASLALEPGRDYDEPALNEVLDAWLDAVGVAYDVDRVFLRRSLVETGLLDRTPDGARYWRPAGRSARSAFGDNLEVAFDEAVESIGPDTQRRLMRAPREMA